MFKAKYYRHYKDDILICELCPQQCKIGLGQIGICKSRKNIDGVLYSLNYGRTVSLNIDPIEKKPLYHFYPGSSILSLGSNSCNLQCGFCQNYSISQNIVGTQEITPEAILDLTRKYKCDSVAFTYTEPITWFEFVLDTSRYLQQNGIKTVMVTNGFINPHPLKELLPYISAWNIDLKSIQNKFYVENCSGFIEPVIATIRTVAQNSHLEITNLIIPGLNDSRADIHELVDFIAEIDPHIPLHLSRYFPHYKMKQPPTPINTMISARDIAQEKLKYVYLGNIGTENKTICPVCSNLLVDRGYQTIANVQEGNCPICKTKIYGSFN
jgi:pyruvate formate lyase activating enzyme